MTAQELLNKLLVGLRRDTISTTSTANSYHRLLIQFLNTIKTKYEKRWPWLALRQTVTLTLVQGQTSYTLTGVGGAHADIAVPHDAQLLYEKPVSHYAEAMVEITNSFEGSQPQVIDTTDNVQYRLGEITYEQMQYLQLTATPAGQQMNPDRFALTRDANNVTIQFWPIPAAARTIKLRFVIPQADIPTTGMDTYTLTMPPTPVWTAALVRAMRERGDASGNPEQLADAVMDAEDALFDALEREKLRDDLTGVPV
jgi:hypothetical protein